MALRPWQSVGINTLPALSNDPIRNPYPGLTIQIASLRLAMTVGIYRLK
ncbi:hypothetical protein ADICYQ_0563 [Cyclobacterium qasimii M12-11B]|uniref:Uncharacterized protein n=1 Tax=Cyclobacterium qasimii M12-11B TaxID=641524 RepID=S7X4Z5_9BACT|nr:hypothetical protein ADICYQ_0563 [Cyclobacterium qasimii M12-11B]